MDFFVDYVMPIFLTILVAFITLLIVWVTPIIIKDITNVNNCVLVDEVKE